MKRISTDKSPAAIGPYSQGLCCGNLVFVSGQIPINAQTGEMAESIEEQARQSLTNVKNILEAEGLTMANVIKTSVFLADLGDFAKVNEVYATFFKEPFPARSCVEVSAIPKGAKVEIECIAVKE
jgi:2-iminobutanoate/2-iminopropanoate deaminase